MERNRALVMTAELVAVIIATIVAIVIVILEDVLEVDLAAPISELINSQRTLTQPEPAATPEQPVEWRHMTVKQLRYAVRQRGVKWVNDRRVALARKEELLQVLNACSV